jgi:hypothetical protein
MTLDGTREPLAELDWSEIAEPGCYLHLVSGLLARVFPEELGRGPRATSNHENRVARLSGDPGTSLAALRIVAARHGYAVHF